MTRPRWWDHEPVVWATSRRREPLGWSYLRLGIGHADPGGDEDRRQPGDVSAEWCAATARLVLTDHAAADDALAPYADRPLPRLAEWPEPERRTLAALLLSLAVASLLDTEDAGWTVAPWDELRTGPIPGPPRPATLRIVR